MSDAQPNRQQDLYWKQLVQLKVSCDYMRRYRDTLGTWVTRFAVLRAIASSGAIGAWAALQAYPMVWGSIIAAAQVADALQNAIPFQRRHHAAGALALMLDVLFIDAQMEWEDVYSGKLDDAAINKRRHKLMRLEHDAQAKYFPVGLSRRADHFKLAEADAASYMEAIFGKGAPS